LLGVARRLFVDKVWQALVGYLNALNRLLMRFLVVYSRQILFHLTLYPLTPHRAVYRQIDGYAGALLLVCRFAAHFRECAYSLWVVQRILYPHREQLPQAALLCGLFWRGQRGARALYWRLAHRWFF
jgi:hypothetical protein